MIAVRLLDALAMLRRASSAAGVSPSDALDEAAALAAAVCGDSAEAAEGWGEVFTRPPSGFAPAAALGKPWMESATPLLRKILAFGDAQIAQRYANAIASVAVEACVLDPDPGIETVTAAEQASMVQLRAAGVPITTPPPADAAAAPKDDKTDKADEPLPTEAELQQQLDGLIGLEGVKQQVRQQTALLRMNKLRAEKGLKVPTVSRHLVFVGNPGTGKTTVARLVAGIYRAMGLLEKGELVESERADLVAGYVGQTAMKTQKIIESAIGSVLFIDEAYALASDNFGEESVATLVKGMEDHRDELVVIVAGYPGPMAEFIATNPGLESRFSTTIVFPDYSDDELVQIFHGMAASSDFAPTGACIERLRAVLAATPRDEGFGNGRFVRNLFEAAVARHAWRLRDEHDLSDAEMRTLEAEDLPDDLIN